jgi:hypothetical protein
MQVKDYTLLTSLTGSEQVFLSLIAGGAPGNVTVNNLAAKIITISGFLTSVSNVGTSGIGVFKDIIPGNIVELNNIAAGSSNVSVTLDSVNNIIKIDGVGYLPLGGGTMSGNLLLNGDPTFPFQAATKNYIDNIATGISWKNPARVATTVNITLSGTQTIDGVLLIVGDKVLVKNQTTQTQNGIYLVASGAWTRSPDASTGAELVSAAILVEEGTTQQDTQWVCTNNNPIIIGTTNIIFVQFGGAGTYTADETTLHLSGNVFSIISTYVGQTSITTLGTVTTGTWSATAIADNKLAVSYIKADGTRPLTGNWNAGSFTGTFNGVQIGSAANTITGLSTIINTGTLTLPTSTDTLTGRATTDTFTNKTYDTAGTGNVFKINGTGITAITGTGSVVLATSPSLTTPNINAATGLSLVLNGTAGLGFIELDVQSSNPASGPANSVRLFSNSTGLLSWKKPSDGFVRSFSSTLTADRVYTLPDQAGTFTLLGNTTTGSGSIVLATSPTLVTPNIGVATATSVNGLTITASTGTLTLTNAKTLSVSNSLTLAGTDATTITFQGTDTYIGRTTTDTLTNKTYDTAGTGNVFKINGTTISAITGTGAVVLANTPTLITPVLGVATATTINKVTFTTPATGSTLTILDGKTLTANNSLTLAGTDATTITFQGTDTYVGRATTDTLTNKTYDTAGTGNVFKINGTSITAVTGTGAVVLATSPTLVTPTIGAATATSISNGDGAVGTPSYTFTSQTGTGFYKSGTNKIGVTSNGSQVAEFNPTGAFVKNNIVELLTATTVAGSATATGAQLFGGIISMTGGGAATLTLDTAANIYSAMGSPNFVGAAFRCMVISTGGTNTTIATNTGLTLVLGSTTVNNDGRQLIFIVTNTATPTITVYGG